MAERSAEPAAGAGDQNRATRQQVALGSEICLGIIGGIECYPWARRAVVHASSISCRPRDSRLERCCCRCLRPSAANTSKWRCCGSAAPAVPVRRSRNSSMARSRSCRKIVIQCGRRSSARQIGIVDSCRQQFIDRERHASEARFAPVVAQRPRQVFGDRQRPDALRQDRLHRDRPPARRDATARRIGRAARRPAVRDPPLRSSGAPFDLRDGGIDGRASRTRSRPPRRPAATPDRCRWDEPGSRRPGGELPPATSRA